MVSHPRLQDSADYGLGCIVGSAYNTVTGGYGASGGAAGAYSGTSCSMGGLPGSYNVNMAVSMNGNTLSSAGGVIRVPAHRPVAGGVHQPLSAAVPAVNGMNGLTGLTFPWMESNRRYTKDRFTGEWSRRDPSSLSAPAAPLPPPPPGTRCPEGRAGSRRGSLRPDGENSRDGPGKLLREEARSKTGWEMTRRIQLPLNELCFLLFVCFDIFGLFDCSNTWDFFGCCCFSYF